MAYKTPANVVELLDALVGAAATTPFYRPILDGRPRITCMDDFLALPVTPLSELRRQPLGATVSDPARVEWIAGTHRGHDTKAVAVAEGTEETALRYGLLRDAVRTALPTRRSRTCAVLAAPERRYFAAEVGTILGYTGTPAHIFIDDGSQRVRQRLRQVAPDILAVLSDDLDEADVPSGVELCLTFRRSHALSRFRQLDIYTVDEFGFLGHSTDLERWIIYNDQYLFERSQDGRLVVTALRNLTQPLLRLETGDTVEDLIEGGLVLGRLSAHG